MSKLTRLPAAAGEQALQGCAPCAGRYGTVWYSVRAQLRRLFGPLGRVSRAAPPGSILVPRISLENQRVAVEPREGDGGGRGPMPNANTREFRETHVYRR